YFGPGYDWRAFKAQGMTESNLHSMARSRFGARGVMQLLPTTFHEIASQNPDIRRAINDPEWNIAAGISYDRRLWQLWEADSVTLHRQEFMFASYNAGRGTILGAQSVAPTVPRWRWRETIGYVHRIDGHMAQLDEHGRLIVEKP